MVYILVHHDIPFILFQSTATKAMLLKADKDYDYDVVLCFFGAKINTIMEVIIAVLEIGENFWGQKQYKRKNRELKKVNVTNLDVTRAFIHLFKRRLWILATASIKWSCDYCCCVFVGVLRFSSCLALGIVKFYETFFSVFET